MDQLPSNRNIKCDVCNVWCSGNISYQNHITGKPHYVALQKQKGVEFGGPNGNGEGPLPKRMRKSTGPTEFVHCDICDIEVTKEALEAHQKGARHSKKIKENEVASEVTSPHIVAAGQGYRCTVCQVDMSGKVVVLSHIKGSKHLRRLSNPLPLPKTNNSKPPNEPIECKICKIFVNSPVVLQQHESSARHKHKAELAAKQAAEETDKQADPGAAHPEAKGDIYNAWDPQGTGAVSKSPSSESAVG